MVCILYTVLRHRDIAQSFQKSVLTWELLQSPSSSVPNLLSCFKRLCSLHISHKQRCALIQNNFSLPTHLVFSPSSPSSAILCRPAADVTSQQLVYPTPPPPHLSDSPASQSPTHSFFLFASAYTAILIKQTRSESLTRLEWGGHENWRIEEEKKERRRLSVHVR